MSFDSIVQSRLLDDSFNSFFTFYSYNYYTCRSSDCCIVRSDNRVSYNLA